MILPENVAVVPVRAPEKVPERSLLVELYYMIETHCEAYGVDLE